MGPGAANVSRFESQRTKMSNQVRAGLVYPTRAGLTQFSSTAVARFRSIRWASRVRSTHPTLVSILAACSIKSLLGDRSAVVKLQRQKHLVAPFAHSRSLPGRVLGK